ncbi:MAG: sulfite exporter TauE/SafE family protein, partial [Bacteroidota bacterium]|nr:sulfite exporter TauE/SafE family protein [Bacteroidota bacterium]
MIEYITLAAIILVGFIAGFVNTVAGSGSLLTLPLLMFLGLPAGIANGTNRVGVLVQNFVGVFAYKKRKILDTHAGSEFALPTAIGGLIGAVLAVNTEDRIMEYVIGIVLFVMFFVFIFKPEKWINTFVDKLQAQFPVIQNIICFLIGVYGGYIQVGVGFFFLAMLVIASGHNMERANALKVYLGLIFTACALIIFFINMKV